MNKRHAETQSSGEPEERPFEILRHYEYEELKRKADAVDGLVRAATAAAEQLRLWMKDHGQDIASQDAIAAIKKALAKAGAV